MKVSAPLTALFFLSLLIRPTPLYLIHRACGQPYAVHTLPLL
jgi:hypothetical protein